MKLTRTTLFYPLHIGIKIISLITWPDNSLCLGHSFLTVSVYRMDCSEGETDWVFKNTHIFYCTSGTEIRGSQLWEILVVVSELEGMTNELGDSREKRTVSWERQVDCCCGELSLLQDSCIVLGMFCSAY